MIDKDSANNRSYVVDVKILDVEKRYKPGPKHYVCAIKKKTNLYFVFLGLCYSSKLDKSDKYIYYLSTLCTIF